MQKLFPHIMNVDHRGQIWQIAQKSWAEVNYIETAASQVRGNHYHKQIYELFFVIDGEVEVIVENYYSTKRTIFLAQKGDTFIIEPYEIHAFHSKTDSKLIAMLSQNIDPDNPDFYDSERLKAVKPSFL